jgi:serine/threonine protein kinase
MALVDRGTLDERLASVPAAGATDVQNVGTQLADCLRVIHDQDMIHRDIKPSNLLIAGPRSSGGFPADSSVLGPSERLVLGDFGLAKDIALQSTIGFTISAGTGGYAAPEQMSPVGVPDQRTDLYAATGVMYRAITGETPPGFDLASETVPFPEHERWMVGDLGLFFRHGMQFYPERRHPSIDAWLDSLRAAVDGMSNGAPASGAPPTVPAGWAGDPVSPPPSSGSFRPDTWAPPTVHTDPNQPSQPSQPAQQPLQDPRSVPSIGAPAVGFQPQQPSPPSTPGQPQPFYPSGQQPYAPTSQQHVAPYPGTGQAAPAYGHPQDHPSQPVLQPANPQTYPPAGIDPRSGQQPGSYEPVSYEEVRGSRGIGKWLALAVIVVAAALGGLWYTVLRPVGPTIVGPDAIQAGQTATYTAILDGAELFEWTDWSGETQQADAFPVTAVAPGALTFSVVGIDADGNPSPSTEHTITIGESPNGPEIVGPPTVTVGQEQIYTFTYSGPGEATDPQWVDGNPNDLRGDTYKITPRQPGTFRVVLIVTLDDGTRIGTAREIQFVN